MILTCPECATGYFVDDAKIGPGGRTVRCKHCGSQWRAHLETPLDLEHDPADEVTLSPSADLTAASTEAPAEPAAKDLPKVYRDRVRSERQIRQAAVTGIVWAGLAAVIALLVGAAVIFRVDMVRLWPRTAAAYAAVGLTVNPIGLVIEQVHAEPALRDGHAALAITGVIRNIEDRAITAPPLRITLLNSEGRTIGGKLAVPTNARIPPGGVRHFAVAVLDPPGSTANLQLSFDRNASPAALREALREVDHPDGHAAPVPGGLRGPAAPAAEPVLPDGLAAPPGEATGATPGVPLTPPEGAEPSPGSPAPAAGSSDAAAPAAIHGTGSTTVTPLAAPRSRPAPARAPSPPADGSGAASTPPASHAAPAPVATSEPHSG